MSNIPNIPLERTNRYERDPDRSLQTRRDDDDFVTPKISVYDADYAVLYWLREYLNLKVIENDRTIDVPIMFSNGETWSQIRQHGYMRDSNNRVITPVINIRRSSMTRDDRFARLEGNLTAPRFKLYDYRNISSRYDRIGTAEDVKRSRNFYMAAMPDFFKVNYEISIWTDFTEQMNELVHEIVTTDRHAWGDTMKFTTYIRDVSFETLKTAGEDRIIKCSMSLELDGIFLKEFSGKVSNIKKSHSVKKVQFREENVGQSAGTFLFEDLDPNPTRKHIFGADESEMYRRGGKPVRFDIFKE